MVVQKYINRGPVEATSTFDLGSLKGKSVVITGGMAFLNLLNGLD
jgi:hypothetical protein